MDEQPPREDESEAVVRRLRNPRYKQVPIKDWTPDIFFEWMDDGGVYPLEPAEGEGDQ